ncbi:MFS transporter [Streptomyces asoensis]|uniref:MFS transporter n=1 Tax=Streptomyces asoensis TaxID=249586 RepID=UPI0036872106
MVAATRTDQAATKELRPARRADLRSRARRGRDPPAHGGRTRRTRAARSGDRHAVGRADRRHPAGRAFGGVLGKHLGWRAPYLVAAALTVALDATLPTTVPAVRDGYPALLADTLHMLRTEKELHRSVLFQVTVFGGFSAAWTAVALLVTRPRYDMGTQAVGVLTLVGAGSTFLAPSAGKWVDRYGADRVNLWCVAAGLATAGVLVGGSLGGVAGIVALAAGLLLIDVAVQDKSPTRPGSSPCARRFTVGSTRAT